MRFGVEDLFSARALVAEQATAAGLSKDRVADLMLAVNELAINAITHGHGGTLRVWARPRAVVCQVEDRGHITDPLAGRRVPTPDVAGGVGLWTVNELCELVEVRTGRDGTTVRVHSALD
jgi:anti-sigma regulatory factor (Ser/Thr protein kinase)